MWTINDSSKKLIQILEKCMLLGLHTVTVRALRNGHHICRVCLSVPCQISKQSEVGMKFYHLYKKLGSPSKNMTTDFAPK